jgi:hypothetical protein
MRSTERLAELRDRVKRIEAADDPQVIESTARELRRLNYDVGLDSEAKPFILMTKEDVLGEIGRVDTMGSEGVLASEEAVAQKLDRLSLLVYNFEILSRLRRDDGEAWDMIEELYGED